MKAFQLTEFIAEPPAAVFALLSDPSKAKAFVDGIIESVKITDGPIGTGTRFRETRTVQGKEATAELVVTEYAPDTTFGISAEDAGIAATYRYVLEPDGDGTLVTWTCDLDAAGVRKVMLPMVAALMKKEDGDHLQRLKRHLERPASTSRGDLR